MLLQEFLLFPFLTLLLFGNLCLLLIELEALKFARADLLIFPSLYKDKIILLILDNVLATILYHYPFFSLDKTKIVNFLYSVKLEK